MDANQLTTESLIAMVYEVNNNIDTFSGVDTRKLTVFERTQATALGELRRRASSGDAHACDFLREIGGL